MLVHLSRLQPYSRQAKHLRTAESIALPLAQRFEGAHFKLHNDDLAIVLKSGSNGVIEDALDRLHRLFAQDPLLLKPNADAHFISWYNLATDIARVQKLTAVYDEHRIAADNALLAAARRAAPPARQADPIDSSQLTILHNTIQQADLSSMMGRQPICAMVPGTVPEPIFDEIHISIENLATNLLPNCDVLANPWLFQDLTRELDRRMIAILMRNDDASLHKSFSINLNVTTITSPEFLELDAALNGNRRNSILIEFQLIDIFSDFRGFLFAREFLRDRGYRICLDGLNHHTLTAIEPPTKLGFDLVKCEWSLDLADFLGGPRAKAFYNAVKAVGNSRFIMSRCDRPQAVQIGHALGISLFQGFHINDLRASTMKSEEKVQRLTDALARQRAATRSYEEPEEEGAG